MIITVCFFIILLCIVIILCLIHRRLTDCEDKLQDIIRILDV